MKPFKAKMRAVLLNKTRVLKKRDGLYSVRRGVRRRY